ncbi:MAG: hypothetical protein OXU94_09790 [Gammaproteobacteria bacterium]|nr:hypothetical protein [Gammaproteobacteria bacterium]
MKLHFNPNQKHQLDAVDAVVRVFEGQPAGAGAKIAVALERIDAATVKDILMAGPGKVITLDRLFQGNDQLKTNTALQMGDAGVGFEVV